MCITRFDRRHIWTLCGDEFLISVVTMINTLE
jgi:hypothetical protein